MNFNGANIMPKKITVISQDYDNCFAIMTQEGFNAEFYGRNKATWESEFIAKGVDIVARTESTREQYNAYLTAITRDANAVRVYVGSDRQSDDLDKLNAAKNGNGFNGFDFYGHVRLPVKSEVCVISSGFGIPMSSRIVGARLARMPSFTPYLN